ncbi:hypothetical protein Tco_0855388 [Tanacetum coccineum]
MKGKQKIDCSNTKYEYKKRKRGNVKFGTMNDSSHSICGYTPGSIFGVSQPSEQFLDGDLVRLQYGEYMGVDNVRDGPVVLDLGNSEVQIASHEPLSTICRSKSHIGGSQMILYFENGVVRSADDVRKTFVVDDTDYGSRDVCRVIGSSFVGDSCEKYFRQSGSMSSAAILSGADNRPPMLEKDMYDSWKSIMELYMMNRQHGRMILESVENGPLIWPTIEENGVTRPKKYTELSAMEAIQADCVIKATNIILQGLPSEVYALVSNHKVAKELWERIQLLMQGTSLTKQERECKLYDEFDKFAYKKGETLREFYLRFSLLLNDMNIYNMKLEQFQVNTKFLNTLPL